MIDSIIRKKIDVMLCEDSLISSVFSLLKYLPDIFIETVLKKSTINDPPKISNFGKLNDIQFWPKFPSHNTTNSRFVEPDIFLEFDSVYIIVEAKRYEKYQQTHIQWRNEIISFFNYLTPKKPLLFYALGGLIDKKNEIININNYNIPVYKLNWSTIIREIRTCPTDTPHYKRVKNDILSLTEKFGFYSGDNLSSLVPKNIGSHNLTVYFRIGFNRIEQKNFSSPYTKEVLKWKTIN